MFVYFVYEHLHHAGTRGIERARKWVKHMRARELAMYERRVNELTDLIEEVSVLFDGQESDRNLVELWLNIEHTITVRAQEVPIRLEWRAFRAVRPAGLDLEQTNAAGQVEAEIELFHEFDILGIRYVVNRDAGDHVFYEITPVQVVETADTDSYRELVRALKALKPKKTVSKRDGRQQKEGGA